MLEGPIFHFHDYGDEGYSPSLVMVTLRLVRTDMFSAGAGQDKWVEELRYDDSRKQEGTFRDVLFWQLELCIE